MKKPKSLFGPVVAKIREEKGLTQLELAQRLGRDQRTVSSMETGLREPLISTVVDYARALGVRAAVLTEQYELALEAEERKQQ